MGKLGLVLSGGGARGAYEVGVLSWLADARPHYLDAVRVLTGASVGAVNAAFLASHGLTPASVHLLEQIWLDMHLDHVVRVSWGRSFSIAGATAKWLFLGGHPPGRGVFDTREYEQLVRRSVDWTGLSHQVASGRFDAFAVAATEVASGSTHVFVDHHPSCPEPTWPHDRSLVAFSGAIHAEHVLASTSLPLLFSPVQIDGRWYSDGGLRQNTPLSPALRLGADRLLTVSMATVRPVDAPAFERPPLGQLLGKLLNGIFIDRLLWDIDRMHHINDVLEAGTALYGPEFTPRLQAELVKRGRRPYAPVRYVGIRPGADIGAMAAELLREPDQLRSPMSENLRRLLTTDSSRVADAASYLLFDGAFARRLMALGKKDAEAQADVIDRLFA